MPAALDLLARGVQTTARHFGTVLIAIEGLGEVASIWTDLGRTAELELNGDRISFRCMVEIPMTEVDPADRDELPGLTGKKVTRKEDGKEFRVVGEVSIDEVSCRFPIDTIHR
jgi:hypothetical protein